MATSKWKSVIGRRAAANKHLLIALAVVLLAASGFWAWKVFSGGDEEDGGDTTSTFVLVCTACTKETETTAGKAKKMEKNAEGRVKCPHCNEFAGVWGREAGQAAINAKKNPPKADPTGLIQP